MARSRSNANVKMSTERMNDVLLEARVNLHMMEALTTLKSRWAQWFHWPLVSWQIPLVSTLPLCHPGRVTLRKAMRLKALTRLRRLRAYDATINRNVQMNM